MEPVKRSRIECNYLDSVNRHLLDFDLIFACGICLTVQNVYCCLSCGRYLEGLGSNSHAWLHSLETQHFLFINTKTGEIICLPECCKVHEDSLSDIKFNLNPEFVSADIQKIYESPQQNRSLTGHSYIIGLVPVNDLKTSAYLSSIVYIFTSIQELRMSLLLNHFSGLTEQLAGVVKKMHNKNNFKSHVCPHELFHIISVLSNGKFGANKKGDPQMFLQWLVNQLKEENYLKRLIRQSIEGKLSCKGVKKRFFLLKIDLPTASPFTNTEESMKVHLKDLVNSYLHNQSISIIKYPKYLILFLSKFKHNKFFIEKNKFSVIFDLDLKLPDSTYTLINVVALDSDPKEKNYFTNTLHINKWYQIHNLSVTAIPESQVCQSDAYILVYSIN